MVAFLPMWYRETPPNSFGGLITTGGRQFRANLSKDGTESNARLRLGSDLGDWLSYSTKFVGTGGVIISWYTQATMKHLDLEDDRIKKLIITYDIDKLTNRMYRAIKAIIDVTSQQVKNEMRMFYVLAQCKQVEVNSKQTLSVITASYRLPSSAILHIRNSISGMSDVVNNEDLIHSIFRKDGLNA